MYYLVRSTPVVKKVSRRFVREPERPQSFGIAEPATSRLTRNRFGEPGNVTETGLLSLRRRVYIYFGRRNH